VQQCGSSTAESKTVVNDSLIQKKDSVIKKQNERIETMEKSMAEIDSLASTISVSNIAPVNAIMNITKNCK
jgi:hypothetical protein